MSKIALILLVIIVFLIVTMVAMFGIKKKDDPNTIHLKLDKGTAVNIVQDEDSTVRVEYTSFEDRPRSVDIFPDLITDLPEQADALDNDFWDKFQHFKECPLDERKEMARKLISHGFLESDYLENIPIEAPKDENGDPVPVSPDPADEDSFQAFWSKPFED